MTDNGAPKKVRKAVIAAAGFGTRFLPQTKAMPKEMLPLVDKPIIQYLVEELCEAGIEDIVIVTGYHKRSIEDHFDHISADLRQNLKQGGKLKLLEETKKISDLANFAYIRQKGPYGTATPLMNAEHLLGNEPFIYTYADDLIQATPSSFSQMVALYEKLGGPIVPCIEVNKADDYDKYGIVAGEQYAENILKMNKLIEKPGKDNAPSNLASVGGFLLTPDVFEHLHRNKEGLSGESEFYLTTYGLDSMIQSGTPVYACKLSNSKYYDTGNKLEYVKTVIDFALDREDIKDEVLEHLRSKLG